MTRQVGIAHLTLLSLTPPELVAAAAVAGADFVGIRVRAVTAQEPAYDMSPGSRLSTETLARVAETGVTVRDIEFLPLTASVTREDWLPALEAGAALGASAFTVTGADADRVRLLDHLAALADDAAPFGITPLLEPISYQPVRRVDDAAQVATAAGAGIMLDSLHIARAASPLADVAALDPALIPVVQLCDAPALAPGDPSNPADVPALQYEARVERMVIGEGELPLADLLRVAPTGVAVSVEVPSGTLTAQSTPQEFIDRNVRAARQLIARVDAELQEATHG